MKKGWKRGQPFWKFQPASFNTDMGYWKHTYKFQKMNTLLKKRGRVQLNVWHHLLKLATMNIVVKGFEQMEWHSSFTIVLQEHDQPWVLSALVKTKNTTTLSSYLHKAAFTWSHKMGGFIFLSCKSAVLSVHQSGYIQYSFYFHHFDMNTAQSSLHVCTPLLG